MAAQGISGLVFANSVFAVTSQSITTANTESCVYKALKPLQGWIILQNPVINEEILVETRASRSHLKDSARGGVGSRRNNTSKVFLGKGPDPKQWESEKVLENLVAQIPPCLEAFSNSDIAVAASQRNVAAQVTVTSCPSYS